MWTHISLKKLVKVANTRTVERATLDKGQQQWDGQFHLPNWTWRHAHMHVCLHVWDCLATLIAQYVDCSCPLICASIATRLAMDPATVQNHMSIAWDLVMVHTYAWHGAGVA